MAARTSEMGPAAQVRPRGAHLAAALVLAGACSGAALADAGEAPGILDAIAAAAARDRGLDGAVAEPPAFLAGRTADGGPSGAQAEGSGGTGWCRRYWREHGWRILLAVGVDQAGSAYEREVGPSSDPLFLQNPPSLDVHLHERLGGPAEYKTFLDRQGLEALRIATPLALVLLDVRAPRRMIGDLSGFVETFYLNRGLTGFAKEIFGRERPALEMARRDGRPPATVERLDGIDGNHNSFPSGHASASFAFAAYLERAIAREIGLRSAARWATAAGVYGVAGYIGWSRIRNGRHWPSDVAAGAALGIAVGRSAYRAHHPSEFRSGKSGRVALGAEPVPGGAALTIDLSRLLDPPAAPE